MNLIWWAKKGYIMTEFTINELLNIKDAIKYAKMQATDSNIEVLDVVLEDQVPTCDSILEKLDEVIELQRRDNTQYAVACIEAELNSHNYTELEYNSLPKMLARILSDMIEAHDCRDEVPDDVIVELENVRDLLTAR